tara:strand:+ start:263 stop:475 length:213 start_codon:yes stop_codon:yes gene_type:complete
MIDTDAYEHILEHVDLDTYECVVIAKEAIAEVKRLRDELKEAKDVIQYALEMSNDDDSTRVFEDYLEVIE